jgi:hypothetical protein
MEDMAEPYNEIEDAAYKPKRKKKRKALSRDEVQSIVSTAVKDAIDFIESEIAPSRVKAQQYFDGKVNIKAEDGRSKVVATKVRDTVRAVKPSLMRVFLSTGRYVEYVPRGPEDIQGAEQATTYMHWLFNEIGGYRTLSDVFHDALIKKVGIAKAYYEDYDASKVFTFTGLDDMQYEAVMADPDIQVIRHEEEEDGTHGLKLLRQRSKGSLCVISVPPEEFFIDRAARNLEDCYVCGHRTDMRVGDLVTMGFDYDEVKNLGSTTSASDVSASEEEARRGYSLAHGIDGNAIDPSMKLVMVTEAYMRIDADGTGIAILHKLTLGGSSYKLLDYEPCDEVPFASFEIDPEPHAFFGRSLADLVMDDQDAATVILRGILDNVSMVNNPGMEAVEGQVNMDDLMNNEIGRIVRVRAPGMINPTAVPFTAGQTMVALQYMDAQTEQKTGVTRASMGLDAGAMQSTTRAAVQATVQAAAGQVEVMARNLAEGGMRRLFGLMLRLVHKHADAAEFTRLNGEFQSVDPRVWDMGMDLTVNVGLGAGREEEKSAMYRETLGLQMQIWQAYGPKNGIVTLSGITNTLTDMLAASGVRNAERYFTPMTPEREAQMMAQAAAEAAQQQGGGADPNAAFLQAEQIKAQSKGQSDMMKGQVDMLKAQMKDDLDRDRMAQDLGISAAELLAKYGVQVNGQMIRAEQDKQRMPMGQPQQPPQGGMGGPNG